MRVVTTDASKKFKIKIKEFHRVVEPGIEFDVTKERFSVLHGNNSYGIIFVERAEDTSSKVVGATKVENKSTVVIEPTVATPVVEEDEEEPEVVIIKPKKTRKAKATATNE